MKIIPTPKWIEPAIEYANMQSFAPAVMRNEVFSEAITSFISYVEKLHGIAVEVQEKASLSIEKDASLVAEGYRIVVDKETVSIYTSDRVGANHAFATLLQMMQVGDGKIILPEVVIEDKPDCTYRGMMIDLSRCWHPFPYLLAYVDLCYFYKASVLQLHFTDDESYTLPSHIYPKLSTPGRSYTHEEIKELVGYAYDRGVELLPEIDVPGHCKSFEEGYRELFGANEVICQHEDSMEAMRALFRELCDMFPHSKYVHIGGDEAIAMDAWTKCPNCLAYGKSVGIDVDVENKKLLAEQFYAHFISEMAKVCFEKGRQPIVWEGFGKEVNDRISKDVIVMSWENLFQLTPDLLEAGFPIINCSWNPTYVVTPHTMWSPEDIYNWSIYQWKATHPQSPILEGGYECEATDRILGGQLHAWNGDIRREFSDETQGVTEQLQCLAERLPMLVERTWNIAHAGPYAAIQETMKVLSDKLYTIIGKEIIR